MILCKNHLISHLQCTWALAAVLVGQGNGPVLVLSTFDFLSFRRWEICLVQVEALHRSAWQGQLLFESSTNKSFDQSDFLQNFPNRLLILPQDGFWPRPTSFHLHKACKARHRFRKASSESLLTFPKTVKGIDCSSANTIHHLQQHVGESFKTICVEGRSNQLTKPTRNDAEDLLVWLPLC